MRRQASILEVERHNPKLGVRVRVYLWRTASPIPGGIAGGRQLVRPQKPAGDGLSERNAYK